MAIYMDYQDVPGEVTTEGYSKWIELNSFQFGIGRGVASAGGQSTRESSQASVSEIVVSKQTDGSSPKLFVESLTGELDNKVTIAMTRTAAGQTQTYMQYVLEGCGISGYSVSSGGDRPTESISLNFDKIEFKYFLVGDNLQGQAEGVGYNLATAKTM